MDGQGGTPSTATGSTNNKANKSYVLAAQTNHNSIFCKLNVGGEWTSFLADTGAEISTLPENHPAVIPELGRVRPVDIQPVTVDGQPIKLQGTLTLKLQIDSNCIPVLFHITAGDHIPPILGLNVMRQRESMKIDFTSGSGTVTFGKAKEGKNTLEQHSTPVLRRITQALKVTVKETYTVPARHEVVISGRLVAKNQEILASVNNQQLIVEPKQQLGEDSVCARSVCCATAGEIPLRVCNPFNKEITLHQGSVVGQAEILPESPVVAALTPADEDIELMTADSSSGDDLASLQKLSDEAEVTPEQKQIVTALLKKYKAAFSLQGELGRYGGMPFKIETGNARPIRQMPRTIPYHRKAEVDRQLDEMLEKKLIAPCESEWASPILLVKKSDGSLRFCIDYRQLNNVTKHDAFPLPDMKDCLASLGGHCRYFSIMDMLSGYWQNEMDEESQEKAAFTTHRGLFKPLVQPFGARGGVAHFSRVMNALLGSLQWEKLLIYLDDILIFSQTFEEHLQRLEAVFKIMIQANLKLKPSKCSVFRSSTKFLGHIVSSEGIVPDPGKIEAIKSWPVPRSSEELQRFLGFASWYRRFIKNFAVLAEPLNKLTRKGVDFQWDSDCEESFQLLRKALINHPVLAYPDFSKPLRLTTDASGTGLGAVLEQDQDGGSRIIACASRTLSAAERNYSVTERECLGIVWATEHFSYYLLGTEFVIITDHDPLTYLRSIPQPHGRLARWMFKLEQYRYTLQHRAGKDIPHADGLSRIPRGIAAMAIPTEWTTGDLVEAQQQDPIIQTVKHYWQLGQKPLADEAEEVREYFKGYNSLEEENGVLLVGHRKGKRMVKQIIAPKKLIPSILQKAHDEEGHYCSEKTLARVRKQYYWTSIFKDVAAYCRTCLTCQQRKPPHTAPRAPLQYFPVASEPGQMIAMDFVGPLPETPAGNRHILVVTDAFSKYAEAIALPNQKATTTADALVEYFSRHGIPAILHSDQGRNFESDLIQHLCRMWNINKTRTSGYHPAGNGACERYNKSLIETLSMQMQETDQSDWEQWIPMALFAYRSTPHSSTGYTPFQLHMGRQPRTPFDTLADSLLETRKKSAAGYLKDLQQVVREQRKRAQQHLITSMEARKRYHDKKLNYRTYEKGEKVLCRDYTCPKGLKPKLIKERWTGPWEIQAVRGPVNYRIQRRDKAGKKKRLLVHHDRLKPYHQRSPVHEQDPKHLSAEPAEESSGPEENLGVDLEPAFRDPFGELGNATIDSEEEEEEEIAGAEAGVRGQQADPDRHEPNTQPLPAGERVTRSGRSSRPPQYLNNYIRN